MAYIPLPQSYPIMGYDYDPATRELRIVYDLGQEGTYHAVPAAEVDAFARTFPSKRFSYLQRCIGAQCDYTRADPLAPPLVRPRSRQRPSLVPPDPR